MSGYSLVFDAASNLRKVGACGMSERCRAPGSRFHLASICINAIAMPRGLFTQHVAFAYFCHHPSLMLGLCRL